MKYRFLFFTVLLSFSAFSQNKQDECAIFIPGTVSQEDENWKISSNCKFKKFSLQLFDRWGETIFRTDTFPPMGIDPWRAKKLNTDVYVYKIEFIYEKDTTLNKMVGHINYLK